MSERTPTKQQLQNELNAERRAHVVIRTALGLSPEDDWTHEETVNRIYAMHRAVSILHQRISEWGSHIACAYCGAKVPKDDISVHIAQCEKHPMTALREENARLRDALRENHLMCACGVCGEAHDIDGMHYGALGEDAGWVCDECVKENGRE